MKIPIHRELTKKVSDWKTGKPVRAPRLGHIHREMSWSAGNSEDKRIDDSKIFHNRQELALGWTFVLIEEFLRRELGQRLFGERSDFTYSDFTLFCEEMEAGMPEGEAKLSPEELTGAVSLAWKALLVGWERAVFGHPEHMYIEATHPEMESHG